MNNKKLTIFFIVILSIITILLTIFFISLLTNGGNFGYFKIGSSYKVSEELIIDETFSNHFSEIIIDSDASDVLIKTGNDNEVRVLVYGDKDKVSLDTNDNNMHIKTTSKVCIGLCFSTTLYKVEVYLPQNYDKKVVINNKYGDISVGELSNLILEIDMDAGDLEAGSIYKGVINNAYGDIKIDNVNDITVTNNYGDIKIKNVNYYMDINADCGDISIDNINIMKNSSINNNLGDISLGKTNEVYINAKTSLGDTKVTNNYPKSDVNLNITNNCGDIKVNN